MISNVPGLRAAIFGLLAIAVVLLPPAPAGGAEPAEPGQAWRVSLGGKLYDNHWAVVGTPPPEESHPSYPVDVDVPAPSTWRCAFCHGWDYRGADGHLGRVSTSPVFVNLRAISAAEPDRVWAALRSPTHERMVEILGDDQIDALAQFLTAGQHDTRKLAPGGQAQGDPLHGQDIYEGACISCHQADGKAFIEGEYGDQAALGWVAVNRPEQALHKIRNGVPGADMLSLRFLAEGQIADLLAYLQTLDTEVE